LTFTYAENSVIVVILPALGPISCLVALSWKVYAPLIRILMFIFVMCFCRCRR